MESLKDDTKGQWIALSGLVISLIIISLALLANQAVVAGFYSSNAALELPKENIRELNLQTRENARIAMDISREINASSNQSISTAYASIFDSCSSQMRYIYALHGETIDVTLANMTYNNSSSSGLVWANISFQDAKTNYVSAPEIIEVIK
ncbi:hypothetical protein HWN40_00095 [Methanolobus zinderi]|jgi:hypothetical protein|uniref:Uncharacterized protein n=1 Tax=Methanolobus zinderi TaxID=536044 RepID=A0A7D5I2S9_9EURY|nr:hypothetical protein [Methanolobus zinderi]QLC48788.1 hypothetical protein HWN40_00095 [Methanolobus zinderi]